MSFLTFHDALVSAAAAPEKAASMQLYGQFIGSWSMAARLIGDDGSVVSGLGDIHFSWVLGGHSVGDVWTLPGIFQGCTLRTYDPTIDAWHIQWCSPAQQNHLRMIGRAQGNNIVQLGVNDAGWSIRWTFCEIDDSNFTWHGEKSASPDEQYRRIAEIHAQRK
jgi:hypothetical protein